MLSDRHKKINYVMGSIDDFIFWKSSSCKNQLVTWFEGRLVIVHECVHNLRERLQHISGPLFITHIHGKVEELSLTKKKHFPGSSTLLCVLNKISHKKMMCAVCEPAL